MTRRPIFAAAVVVMFMLLYSGSALAIYSWVDEKGQTHISDYPRPRPESPAEQATGDAGKEKKEIAAPVVPGPAMKTDQTKSAGDSARQPSPVAAPVPAPAPPKHEQPVAPPSPLQPRPVSVSSPTITTPALPAQSVPAVSVSPIVTQQGTPIDTKASGAAMQNGDVPQLIKAFMSMFLIFLVVGYVYFSLCLFLIARKLNVSNAWLAWVPIAQILTLLWSASKPAWWVLLFFVPLVNLIVMTYVWMCISENLGRNKWLGFLMLVPVANLIYLGMLAFSKQGSR